MNVTVVIFTIPMVQSAEDKYMSAGLSDHFTP